MHIGELVIWPHGIGLWSENENKLDNERDKHSFYKLLAQLIILLVEKHACYAKTTIWRELNRIKCRLPQSQSTLVMRRECAENEKSIAYQVSFRGMSSLFEPHTATVPIIKNSIKFYHNPLFILVFTKYCWTRTKYIFATII